MLEFLLFRSSYFRCEVDQVAWWPKRDVDRNTVENPASYRRGDNDPDGYADE
ncbi:MAG TPA: hypothetical protein VG826_36120 [Pirellulales bacterium]|nr:hypothetical protein [Pirellulales bacterium]